MKWNRELRIKLAVAALLLLLSTLTACTVSAAGGIIGGAGAIGFAVFLFVTGTTQSGCGPTFGPCLSVAPCLSEPYIPPDDAGPIENVDGPADAAPYVGPCLSVAIPPADAGADAWMGPCLSPPPEDVGPCLSPPFEPDLGVCLSELFDIDGEPFEYDTESIDESSIGDDRKSSIDKLESKLPDDVVRRLRGPRDEAN